MISLYGWGPMFGAAGPSPFVMKADMQLQMLGVHFARAVADLDSVPKRKAPYVVDDGRLVEDSTFIRFYFEAKTGRDLDEGLSGEQRAAAWGLERLLEDRLNLIMAHERWLEDVNFERGPRLFFAGLPEPAQSNACAEVRRQLRNMMIDHGVGRHSRQERIELADRDIAAIAGMLGDKDYMFGSTPTALDASAYGVLASCATPFFETPLVELVSKRPQLVAYLKRIEARYFSEPLWPAMAA